MWVRGGGLTKKGFYREIEIGKKVFFFFREIEIAKVFFSREIEIAIKCFFVKLK